MLRRLARFVLIVPLALGALAFLAAATGAADRRRPQRTGGATGAGHGPSVVVLTATGIVDNVMAGLPRRGRGPGRRDGAAAVVIAAQHAGRQPGRDPAHRLDAARRPAADDRLGHARRARGPPVPGRSSRWPATSRVMAPGTNIGAATPVGGSGEDIEGDLGQKVLNDAVASIRSIAETRGRNADWAEETVRDARSSTGVRGARRSAPSTASPARSTRSSPSPTAGWSTVARLGRSRIATSPAPRSTSCGMNPAQQLLHLLSDPNIAFILFTLGFYGLLFELQSPNFVTGILGALAIVLAFIGFGSLPLNVAGLLLIVLAIVLFLPGVHRDQPRPAHGRGASSASRWGRRRCTRRPGTPTAPVIAVDPAIIVALTTVTGGVHGVHPVRRRAAGARQAGATLGMSTGPVLVLRRPSARCGSACCPSASSTLAGRNGRPGPTMARAIRSAALPCAGQATDGLTAHRRARPITRPGREPWARPRRIRMTELPLIATAVAIVVLLLLVLWLSIRVVNRGDKLVIYRLGNTDDSLVKGPGLVFLIPFIDRPKKVNLREQFVEVPSQTAITKDNVTIPIDFLIYWRIIDPLKTVVNVAGLRRGAGRRGDDEPARRRRRLPARRRALEARPDQRGPADQARRDHRELGRQGHPGRDPRDHPAARHPRFDEPDAVRRAQPARRHHRVGRRTAVARSTWPRARSSRRSSRPRASDRPRSCGPKASARRSPGSSRRPPGSTRRRCRCSTSRRSRRSGPSPSTKFVIPFEFTRLLEPFLDFVNPTAVEHGATRSGGRAARGPCCAPPPPGPSAGAPTGPRHREAPAPAPTGG